MQQAGVTAHILPPHTGANHSGQGLVSERPSSKISSASYSDAIQNMPGVEGVNAPGILTSRLLERLNEIPQGFFSGSDHLSNLFRLLLMNSTDCRISNAFFKRQPEDWFAWARHEDMASRSNFTSHPRRSGAQFFEKTGCHDVACGYRQLAGVFAPKGFSINPSMRVMRLEMGLPDTTPYWLTMWRGTFLKAMTEPFVWL